MYSTLRNLPINPHTGVFLEGIGLVSGEKLDPRFGTFALDYYLKDIQETNGNLEVTTLPLEDCFSEESEDEEIEFRNLLWENAFMMEF